MGENIARFVLVPLAVLIAGATACVSTHQKLPLIDGKEAVAMVNGEPITQEDYEQEISLLHASRSDEKNTVEQLIAGGKPVEQKASRIDYAGLMKRMIDARLIVQEAKRIGLNELPEVRREVENYSQKAQRTLLIKQITKDVKPDERVIDELYKKSTHEWKFKSLMFPNEDDARGMKADIKAGGNFDDLAGKAVAHKKARGSLDEGYLKGNEILPQIYNALCTMKTGSASDVIPVPGGYALVKLDDDREVGNPGKRSEAAEEALRMKQVEVSRAFIESLKDNLVKTDTKLLDSLDFEASVEAFDKLMKDGRVVAEIGGNDRITVSDLAGETRRAYYHGIEGQKNLNSKKNQVLDKMVEKKVLDLEARNKGIDKMPDYLTMVKIYENSLAFGMFLQKVVLPEVKITEQEIKAYYDAHRSDYSSPELLKLESIVFKKRSDAENAMRKLRAGDQFSWIRSNAEGQVDKGDESVQKLDGSVVAVQTLADGLRNALAGAAAGDFRLYEGPEGYFYTISVANVYPPATQDYTEVRPMISRKLYNEHTETVFEGWVEKLRSVADIKVYLKY